MGVNAERHLDLRVAKTTLDDMRRNARRQHQCRHSVAQSVEFDSADARRLDEPSELPLPNRVHLKRETQRVGATVYVAPFLREQEPKIVIVLSVPHLDRGLMLPVFLEQVHGFS